MGWGHIPMDGMCMKFIIACSAESAPQGPQPRAWQGTILAWGELY